jgi:lipopolysaccharide export system permease protein
VSERVTRLSWPAAWGGLLDRYVARAVIAGSLASLVVFVSLIFIFSFIEEVGDLSADYTAFDAMLQVGLQVPQRAYESFPVATLIGSLMTLGGLAARSELVVMRAAGMSVLGVARSVVMAGLLLGLIAAAVGEWVAPPAERLAKTVRGAGDAERMSALSPDGFWARDGNQFVHVGRAPSASFLNDVAIYQFGVDKQLEQVTSARMAHYEPGGWQLTDVVHTVFDGDRVRIEPVERLFWLSEIAPDLLSVVVVDPEALSIVDLQTYIAYLERNALDSQRYRLALWIKIATPLATLTMLILTIPLVFGSLRAVNAGQRIFIGVMIGIGFFLGNNLLNHAGLVYGLPPALSALLPTLIVLVIAVYAASRIR